MMLRFLILAIGVIGMYSCDPNRRPVGEVVPSDGGLTVSGSMHATMRQGRIGGSVDLDTLADRDGLYGLGPALGLRGEVTIYDGESYVSRVAGDGAVVVRRTYDESPPFFVHTHQRTWNEYTLPPTVRNLEQLQDYIDDVSIGTSRPFAFRLTGVAEHAELHVMNVPEGLIPESMKQAHRYQESYTLTDEPVDILGFFSTSHQGIFTHPASYQHLHVLTRDRRQMGHLDALRIGEGMKLFLPE
jgi:acetolactate decarboxylase